MDSHVAIARSHLYLKTNLEALLQVLGEFDRVAAAVLVEEVYFKCRLAIAEGFTNTVRHAHCHLSEETVIEVEMALSDRLLEVFIWDKGEPFDLYARLQEIEREPDNPLKVGERGLQWMNELMDEVGYIRVTEKGDRNCLILRKHLRDGDRRF
ncbi:MAG: ATP-binding protein [Cyanobacteria bacterium SBLK]|nr:ATP-binding protein [Cyanobacteria bacterium SBLK]